MAPNAREALGLIAGRGRLPLEIARSARDRGPVAAIAFHGQTEREIDALCGGAGATWIYPGEVGAAIDALRAAGATRAVLAGKVPKADL